MTSVQKLNLRRWRRAQPPRQEFCSATSSNEKPLTQHCSRFSSGKYALQATSTHADAAKKAVSTLGAQTGPASLHTCSPPSEMALHIQKRVGWWILFSMFFFHVSRESSVPSRDEHQLALAQANTEHDYRTDNPPTYSHFWADTCACRWHEHRQTHHRVENTGKATFTRRCGLVD